MLNHLYSTVSFFFFFCIHLIQAHSRSGHLQRAFLGWEEVLGGVLYGFSFFCFIQSILSEYQHINAIWNVNIVTYVGRSQGAEPMPRPAESTLIGSAAEQRQPRNVISAGNLSACLILSSINCLFTWQTLITHSLLSCYLRRCFVLYFCRDSHSGGTVAAAQD